MQARVIWGEHCHWTRWASPAAKKGEALEMAGFVVYCRDYSVSAAQMKR